MLSLWANWLVTKFWLSSRKRYLWPVLYILYLGIPDSVTLHVAVFVHFDKKCRKIDLKSNKFICWINHVNYD